MNYMKEVAQMLGVELGEKFKVEGFDDKFKLTSNGMFYYDEENSEWQKSLLIYDILKGTREIVKPILDEKEKEYLSYVFRPFKDKVEYIYKYTCANANGDYEAITVIMEAYGYCEYLNFPKFKKGSMYKNMKVGKEYSLEELGL